MRPPARRPPARCPPARCQPARALGWLLLLDGVAVLIWFLQTLLAPAYPAISYPTWVVGFVAEVGLALWLLIKGTHPERSAPHTPTS